MRTLRFQNGTFGQSIQHMNRKFQWKGFFVAMKIKGEMFIVLLVHCTCTYLFTLIKMMWKMHHSFIFTHIVYVILMMMLIFWIMICQNYKAVRIIKVGCISFLYIILYFRCIKIKVYTVPILYAAPNSFFSIICKGRCSSQESISYLRNLWIFYKY